MHSQDSLLLRSVCLVLIAAGCGVSWRAQAACAAQNTCFGINALQSITTGDQNSAFGYEALFGNTDGSSNSAFGAFALRNNTGGRGNTAVGVAALRSNTIGGGNTAVGNFALADMPATGISNTAIGEFAMTAQFGSTAGTDFNTALGAVALFNLQNGNNNTAVGYNAMQGPPESGIVSAVGNTAVGARAMESTSGGEANTAVGYGALLAISQESPDPYSFNTAVGGGAIQLIWNGEYNTAIGYHAMLGDQPGITGDWNTANGANALMVNTSGVGNTATGYNSLHSNSTGIRNTGNGINSLGKVTTGARNTALGAGAGSNITTGSDNVIIGAQNSGIAAENGVIRIGNGAYQKKAFVAGIRGVTTGLANATTVFIDGNGQLGTKKSSREYKEDIHPIDSLSDRLGSLRPVAFRYKQAYDDGSKPVEYGLIAEEVAEVFPELVVYNQDDRPETVRYDLLSTLLVNEFQKEQAVVGSQAATISSLQTRLAELEARLENLENSR